MGKGDEQREWEELKWTPGFSFTQLYKGNLSQGRWKEDQVWGSPEFDCRYVEFRSL